MPSVPAPNLPFATAPLELGLGAELGGGAVPDCIDGAIAMLGAVGCEVAAAGGDTPVDGARSIEGSGQLIASGLSNAHLVQS